MQGRRHKPFDQARLLAVQLHLAGFYRGAASSLSDSTRCVEVFHPMIGQTAMRSSNSKLSWELSKLEKGRKQNPALHQAEVVGRLCEWGERPETEVPGDVWYIIRTPRYYQSGGQRQANQCQSFRLNRVV